MKRARPRAGWWKSGGSAPRVMALAGIVSAGWGCAGAGFGPPASDWTAELVAPAAVAAGCGANGVLDATTLGIAPPRLTRGRGADLSAYAAQIDAVIAAPTATAATAVLIATTENGRDPGSGVSEVAGVPRCEAPIWAWLTTAPGARLVRPNDAAAAAMQTGIETLDQGRAPEARVAWSAAARTEAAAPAPWLAIAQSYLTEGRFTEAASAYAALLDRFAGNPLVYAGLGDALRQADRRGEAVDAWARGIALWPSNGRLVRRAAADPFVEARPLAPPPARRMVDGRWIQAPAKATGARSPEAIAAVLDEAQTYAGCKERLRVDPVARVAVTGQSESSTTWGWSPAEETACTALWLRAYQRNRERGRLEDPALDDLLTAARAGFLDARSLFDVGAFAHPLATALLTADERQQLFDFVVAHRVIRRRSGGWLF